MKTVLLLRHAKSSWNNAKLLDFERPLNERGRAAAKSIGRYITRHKLNPDLVLSSPAVRARETADLVLKSARLQVEIRQDERIYEAGPLRLLEVVSQIDEDKKNVLLVGHNPGMEELLQRLTGQEAHMPTATLAKIKIVVKSWENVLQEKGKLEWLIKAKELED
jgi:phosphohistidine phosphatase